MVGIEQFYRACAGVKIVLEGDAVVELHDGAVGLPDGEVNGVGLIEHRLRGGDVDRLHNLRDFRAEEFRQRDRVVGD